MNNDTPPKLFDPVYTYQSTIYFMAMLFTRSVCHLLFGNGFLVPLYFSLGIILLFGTALYNGQAKLFSPCCNPGLITLLIDIPGMVYFLGISVGIHHYLLVVNVLISASASIKTKSRSDYQFFCTPFLHSDSGFLWERKFTL